MGLLLQTLRGVEFLAELPDDALTRFMVLGRAADHARAHVFWRAGSTSGFVVIPVSGRAKCTARGADGREFIASFRGPGDCIGLAAALDGLPHASDAIVLRAGEFFTVPAEAVRTFVRDHPPLVAAAVRQIGRQLRRVTLEREDYVLRPLSERLAHFLIENACVRQAGGARVLVDARQADIAARLGTVREVVARNLADLIARGLISRAAHGLHIDDWDGLHEAAGLRPDEVHRRLATFGPSPAARTARYFLPALETDRADADARGCRRHLGDIAACRSAGCPAALRTDS